MNNKTAYELLKEYYPKDLETIEKVFPKFIEASKEIKIIPWRDEFNITDKNPEIIDKITLLEELLKNDLISEEEYQKEMSSLGMYASKTLGISFNEDKIISFREKVPKKYVIIHEIGHVYFDEPDLSWNGAYGAGEIFFWLAVEGKLKITEEDLKKYMEIYRKIFETEDKNKLMEIYKEISNVVTKDTGITNDLIVAKLFAGTMPGYEVFQKYEDYEIVMNSDGEEIKKKIENQEIKLNPKYLKAEILMFLSAGLSDGIIYNDPAYHIYAKNFFENINEIHQKIIEITKN